MEHSLHLGAGHFVKEVAPTSSRNILKTIQHVDVEDAKLEDSEGKLEAADSIRKALALVNQVSIRVLETFLHPITSMDRSTSHRRHEHFL